MSKMMGKVFFYIFEDIMKKQTVSNWYYNQNLSTT